MTTCLPEESLQNPLDVCFLYMHIVTYGVCTPCTHDALGMNEFGWEPKHTHTPVCKYLSSLGTASEIISCTAVQFLVAAKDRLRQAND